MKVQNSIILQIIIFIQSWIWLGQPFTSASTQLSTLYRSQYLKTYNSSPNSQMNMVKLAKNSNLVFVSTGISGIIVVDPSKQHQIVCTSQVVGNIMIDFDVNDQGTQIYTYSPSKGFNVFAYNSVSQTIQNFYIDAFLTNSDLIAIIFSSVNSKVYVGFQDGSLRVYNVTSTSVTFYTQISLQLQNSLNGFQISADGRFIVVGNYGDGNIIYRQHFQSNTIQLINYVQIASTLSFRVLLNDKNTVLFSWNYWIGLSIFLLNDQLNQIDSNNSLFNLPVTTSGVLNYWWVNTENMPQSFVIKLSSDNSLLYLGARSYGFYVIDVNDPSNIQIAYNIPQELDAVSMVFTSDESYLYTTNMQSLFIYEQQRANYNTQYLNFYNPHRSINGFPYTPQAKFYGYLDPNEQFLVTTLETGGVALLQILQNPLRLKTIEIFVAGLVDNVSVLSKTSTLVFPSQIANELVRVYDITDFTKPVLLQIISSNEGSVFRTGQQKTRDENFIFIEDGKTIKLIDCSQKGQFFVRKVYDVSFMAINQFCSVFISVDDKYIIFGICQVGIYAFDITDVDDMKFVAEYPLQQSMFFSEVTQTLANHLYASNGLNGFLVFDLSQLPHFKLIASVSASGYVSRVVCGQDESFAIASTFDQGSLSLFDMTDKSNPLLISRFIYGLETSNRAFLQSSYNYIYILGLTQIRILPLFSTCLIHSEISEILNYQTNLQSSRMMGYNETFYVGQYIQYQFQIIYPKQGQMISNIFYLQNNNLLPLPFWVQFDYYQYNMVINVVKEALGSMNAQEVQLQTVILQTSLPVETDAFITTLYGIDSTMSQNIWSYLSQQNIIGQNNYLQQVFRREQQLQIFLNNNPSNQLSSDQLEYVKSVLSESIMYNPIYFKISNSLSVDVKSLQQVIKTNSTQISLQINIDSSVGQLVSIIQSSSTVVFSINTQRNQIIISGLPVNVNNFLSSKLQIFLFNTTDPSSVNVEIQVNDYINFVTINNYLLPDVSFLEIRKPIAISLPLQDYLNEQFSNSDIPIVTDIQVTFSQSTFKNCNFQDLKLKAEVKTTSVTDFVELLPTYWLQFQPQSFRMTGQASSSMFLSRVCIKITADDSYSQVSDEFCVYISLVPFVYALNLIIQIVGPLAFFFSFIKFKYAFYNMIFPRFNVYSSETVEEGEHYFKKIPIIGSYMDISKLFFQQFLSSKRLTVSGATFSKSKQMKFFFLKTIQKMKLKSQQDYLKWEFKWKFENLDKSQFLFKEYEEWFTNLSLSDCKINFNKILSAIYSNNGRVVYLGQMISIADYFKELNDQTSLITNCLKSLICFHLINQESSTKLVYEYIKQYLYNRSQLQDWYLDIVKIKSVDEKNKYGQQTPLPKTELRQQEFESILDQAKSILQQNTEKVNGQQNDKLHVYTNLISMALQFEALGLTPKSNIFSFSSKGESLHIQEQDLQLIETFKIIQHSNFSRVRKFFNLEYAKITTHLNNKLPNWMKYEYQKSLILIQGTPSLHESNDILLRFYDTSGYILRQQKIIINHKMKKLEVDYLDEFNQNDQHIDWALNTQEHLRNTDQIINNCPATKEELPKIKSRNSVSEINNVEYSRSFRSPSFQYQLSSLQNSQEILFSPKGNMRSIFAQQKKEKEDIPDLNLNNKSLDIKQEKMAESSRSSNNQIDPKFSQVEKKNIENQQEQKDNN